MTIAIPSNATVGAMTRPSRWTSHSTRPPYSLAESPSAMWTVPSAFLASVISSPIRAAGFSPMPISPMLSASRTLARISRSRSAGESSPWTATARPPRTSMRIGDASAPRSEATRSHTITPSAVPSTGGSDTSPPGSAETSPGLRQIPVSQAIGSRPVTVARRSVPAAEVTRTSRTPRHRSASASARSRMATKSAVMAPSRQASARYGALKSPRAPARCAAALAAVWYRDVLAAQSTASAAANAAAAGAGGSAPLRGRGAMVTTIGSPPASIVARASSRGISSSVRVSTTIANRSPGWIPR